MIVASFLTKDLHIDWRWGEKYFLQNLIDGDVASNNGGWQWAAGTGTDAQPFFRIFNPILQGRSIAKENDRAEDHSSARLLWLSLNSTSLAAICSGVADAPHAGHAYLVSLGMNARPQ